MTVVSDLSDQSDLSDNAISRIVLMYRERLCVCARDLPKCAAKSCARFFWQAVRAEVAFCDGRKRRSALSCLTERATEQGARSAEMRRKKTLKGVFRRQKAVFFAFLTFLDLINPAFDVILYDADGYPGINCALMAVCCIPDFPDAASLPARSEFA